MQPLDFFGDGTRIPLIVVSPYSTGGHILAQTTPTTCRSRKFIEANWHLDPITHRSRDNLPEPAEATGQSLCSEEFAGDRRPDGFLFDNHNHPGQR